MTSFLLVSISTGWRILEILQLTQVRIQALSRVPAGRTALGDLGFQASIFASPQESAIY